MINLLVIIISFFLLGFLVLIVLVGVKFLYNLVTAGKSSNNCNEEIDNQLRENSRENSQADLYMSKENPDDNSLMFPEEFDDEV